MSEPLPPVQMCGTFTLTLVRDLCCAMGIMTCSVSCDPMLAWVQKHSVRILCHAADHEPFLSFTPAIITSLQLGRTLR